MKYESRPVYRSSNMTIGIFRCHPSHPEFWQSVRSGGNLMVFPRTCVKIFQTGQRPVIADPNVVMFYNKDHEYRREPISESGDRCEWVSYSNDAVMQAVQAADPREDLRPESPFPFTHCRSDDATYLMQRHVFRSIRLQGDSVDSAWVERTMIDLLRKCVVAGFRLRANHPVKISNHTKQEHRNLVLRTRMVLASEFKTRLTLNDLATRVGCSPYHLSRIFRRETGQSIHRYLTQLRLRTALEELEPSEKDLTTLALKYGFSSHSHFTFAFRQHFGTTPSAWKRNQIPQDRVPLMHTAGVASSASHSA